jgi:predicted PurR-regulated permease PerM
MARLVSLAVLLTLIVVLGITFFRVVAPFLLPLFLAGVLAMLCQPVFRYFLTLTKERIRLSAALATVCITAAILVPLVVGTLAASVQLYSVAVNVTDTRTWGELFGASAESAEGESESIWERAVEYINPMLPSERQFQAGDLQTAVQARVREALNDLGDRSLRLVTGTMAAVGSALMALLIFVVSLYYFFADGTMLLSAAQRMIPVQVDYQRELLFQFARAVRSVVLATFLSALGQALATTIALAFLRFDHIFMLFVLTFVASMIPLAGAWLIWLPCALVLFKDGHTGSAIFLAIYGAAFVGVLDNVLRTYMLNASTKLHPLLAFISVLGGLQVLGLWGVFIGPIVASCLHALVKIFNHELLELSKERFGPVLDVHVRKQPATGVGEQAAKLSVAVSAASDAPASQGREGSIGSDGNGARAKDGDRTQASAAPVAVSTQRESRRERRRKKKGR